MLFDQYLPELNLTTRERVDLLFATVLGKDYFQYYICYQLLIMCLGTALLFRTNRLIILLLLTSALSFIPLPQVLRWYLFPLLLSAILSFEQKRTTISGVIVIIISLLFSLTIGPNGAVGGILALSFWFFVSSAPHQQSVQFVRFICTVLLLGSVLFLPTYSMQSYPKEALLSPNSPLRDGFSPILIGPIPKFVTIFYPTYRLTEFATGLYVAAICCCLWFSYRSIPSLFFLLLGLLFSAVSGLFPDNLREYAVQATLWRIAPGTALEPLPWVFFTPIVFACLAVDRSKVPSKVPANFTVLSCLIAALVFHFMSWSGMFSGIFSGNNKLSWNNTVHCLAESEEIFPTCSPSNFVRNHFLPTGHQISPLSVEQAVSYEVESITASNKQEQLANIVDNDEQTRWGSGRPQQLGEKVEVVLKTPINFQRVDLNLGPFYTDFPRGLQIEISQDGVGYEKVFEQSEWYGAIHWNFKGEPYFGKEEEMKIVLNKAYQAKHVRFVLLGSHNYFDWSIAELKFYKQ
jgi:hypothetical protein